MTTTVTILGVALSLAALFITLNCRVITRLRRSKTHIDSLTTCIDTLQRSDAMRTTAFHIDNTHPAGPTIIMRITTHRWRNGSILADGHFNIPLKTIPHDHQYPDFALNEANEILSKLLE